MIDRGTNSFHEPSVDEAYILIVVLDGSQVDDGTAWENGYFFKGKSAGAKIIGIRTDFRRAGGSEGAVVNAIDRGVV